MRRFHPAALIAGMMIVLTAACLLLGHVDGKADLSGMYQDTYHGKCDSVYWYPFGNEAQQTVDEATWSSVKAMFHEPPEFPDLTALDWDAGEIHEYVNDKGQRVTLKCWQVNGWWVCITLAHEPEIAELTGWENYDFLGDLDRPHIGGPRP